MIFFIEICKGIFFFLSIVVGIFLLRGEQLINRETYILIKEVLMPGYLIFCGIMVGYIWGRVQTNEEEDKEKQTKTLTKTFMIGTSVGILLAVIYIVI